MTVAIILFALIAVVVTYVTLRRAYDDVLSYDRHCDSAWNTILDQLARRNELVLRLVREVEERTGDYADALRAIEADAAAVLQATGPRATMEASTQLGRALDKLLNTTRPDAEPLAGRTLEQLRNDIADAERKISHARMTYNERVREYNEAIAAFPGSVIAHRRFRPRESLEGPGEAAHELPTVKC